MTDLINYKDKINYYSEQICNLDYSIREQRLYILKFKNKKYCLFFKHKDFNKKLQFYRKQLNYLIFEKEKAQTYYRYFKKLQDSNI